MRVGSFTSNVARSITTSRAPEALYLFSDRPRRIHARSSRTGARSAISRAGVTICASFVVVSIANSCALSASHRVAASQLMDVAMRYVASKIRRSVHMNDLPFDLCSICGFWLLQPGNRLVSAGKYGQTTQSVTDLRLIHYLIQHRCIRLDGAVPVHRGYSVNSCGYRDAQCRYSIGQGRSAEARRPVIERHASAGSTADVPGERDRLGAGSRILIRGQRCAGGTRGEPEDDRVYWS